MNVDLNVWVLNRIEPTRHDEYLGFVIVAPTADEARKIADRRVNEDGVWLNPQKTTCRVVNQSVSGIVLDSYKAW